MNGCARLSSSVATATNRILCRNIRYWTYWTYLAASPNRKVGCVQRTRVANLPAGQGSSGRCERRMASGCGPPPHVRRVDGIISRTFRAVVCKDASGVTWPRLELFGSAGVAATGDMFVESYAHKLSDIGPSSVQSGWHCVSAVPATSKDARLTIRKHSEIRNACSRFWKLV